MIFLAIMAVVVLLEVIFRYALHLPLFWTDELARYCLVWASLLGAAVALKRGEHIAVAFFVDRFPERVSKALTILGQFSVATLLMVMFWGGIKLVMITSAQISPALRIPMAIPYLALPISSSIMLIHVITSLIHRPSKIGKSDRGIP